jgi:hypothetical protein
MKPARRMAWILGWAIPAEWFKTKVLHHFPDDRHTLINASEDFFLYLKKDAPYDHIIGYSLGSLIVLLNQDRIQPLTTQVTLLSPILAFTREKNLGGLISLTQLQYAKRSLKSDPRKACLDFYAHAGLDIPEALISSLNVDNLNWGLEQLEYKAYSSPIPKMWNVYAGQLDLLTSADFIKREIPQATIIEQATHEPTLLIKAIAEFNA